MNNDVEIQGGCHCGAVRFKAVVDLTMQVLACNCSICQMSGYQHLIMPAARFRLLCGTGQLSEYRFGSKVARHLFCPRCGVKSFYIPRSNPDGVSLNVRCLELPESCKIQMIPFDGINWSKNAASLRHLHKG